jgi:hypothetical protein
VCCQPVPTFRFDPLAVNGGAAAVPQAVRLDLGAGQVLHANAVRFPHANAAAAAAPVLWPTFLLDSGGGVYR